MSLHRTLLLLICGSLICLNVSAQDPPEPAGEPAAGEASADDADHKKLRALRDALTEAILAGDTEEQLKHVDGNVVATWQNNRVVRGVDGLREFFQEMNGGDSKVFQGYTVPPTADEPTILRGGETGIVFGQSVPHYNYMGMEFDLENRWTATVVKDETGDWKIASYHVSANVVDNPFLTVAKKSLYWGCGISLVVGLLIGIVGSRVLRGRRQASDAS